MLKKISVEVTQNDIKYGRKDNPCMCMVARALKRRLNVPQNAYLLHVLGPSFTLRGYDTEAGHEYIFGAKFSKRVQDKIRAFDNLLKSKMTPFKFTVKVDESIVPRSK